MYMQSPDIYESNGPYLFISDSHKDQQALISVKHILEKQNVSLINTNSKD